MESQLPLKVKLYNNLYPRCINNMFECGCKKYKRYFSYKEVSHVITTDVEIFLKSGKPTVIWIISSWRSGSTFLADVLKEIPGTYYTFEPLLYLTQNKGLRLNFLF